MIKCLVSDVDGTLFLEFAMPSGEIEASTIAKIQNLTQSGVRFVMASGRDHLTSRYLEAKLNVKVDGIGQNGGVVMIDEEVIVKHPLDEKIVHALAQLTETTKCRINVLFIDDRGTHVLTNASGWVYDVFVLMLQRKEITQLIAQDFKQYRLNDTHPMIKAVVICDTVEDRDAFTREMEAALAAFEYDWFYSSSHYVEIMSKDVNKGSGVLHLAKVLDLKTDEIAVVGDSYNDISMFKVTPYSFAMHHGDHEVRVHANYEVKRVDEVVDFILEHNAQFR